MNHISFDDIYMNLAISLANKSHCIKKKVGAVLAKDTRIISIGYNGPPAGTYNCDEQWPDEGCERDLKGGCSLALHAEQNAILYAVKNNSTIEGATLYVTLAPCLPCARIMLSVGIHQVLYIESYADYKDVAKEEGLAFLERFGVITTRYPLQ